MKPSYTYLSLTGWGILILVLHLLAAVTGSPILWGVDPWAYLPAAWTAGLGVLGILFIIPASSGAIVSFFTAAWEKVFHLTEQVSFHLRASAVALLAGALFWRLRCSVHLLGDGYLLVRNLEEGGRFRQTHRYLFISTGWFMKRAAGSQACQGRQPSSW